jgi:NADPH:quinone reductase-like Zn-dependent oxidoreductase
MKAIVYEKYGSPEVLHLIEVAKPTPKENEVLIKIHATTVTVGDVRMRSFTVPRVQWLFARLYLGVFKPRRAILGMELAGTIEAVGKDVSRFQVGDPVFASTFAVNFGGYAEYKCMAADGILALKPENLAFEEAAAAVGGGMTALRCLRKGHIQPGQQVLIYGASGAVGSNAVQLAKHHFGAEVTAVCSTANVAWVKALGANQVIDYTQEDFAQSGATYDVVFDAVAKFPSVQAKKALKASGIYLNVHRDTHSETGRNMLQDLLDLKELIEAGQLKPVIDCCYPLDQMVEAHRYVDQGHKKGNVVITVIHDDPKRISS